MSIIIPAVVASVKIGDAITVEGLELEDGSHAIAQQQVALLFSVMPTSAPKWVKRLLGKDCQLFQVLTNRQKQAGKQNRAETAISISDFRKIIRKLDKEGNLVAEQLTDALTETTLKELFFDAFGRKVTPQTRQDNLNRLLPLPNPWERMYEKDMCDRVVGWFGVQFFWRYVYYWMTAEERIFLDQVNPIVNGDRSKGKIHQFLTPEIRDRLTPYIYQLVAVVKLSHSRQEFEANHNRLHGIDQQTLNLDI